MLVKVNYIAVDKGKSFICRVFIEAEMILFYVYAEFHIISLRIFPNDFLHSSLMNFFWYKSSGTR